MDVAAVVVGRGGRGSLDVLTPVGGVPLLVRSVRGLLAAGVVDRVAVLGMDGRRDAVVRACDGLPVDVRDGGLRHGSSQVPAHVDQRALAAHSDGLITLSRYDVVLVHDAARPLTPPGVVAAVLAAVRADHDVAVPVLPLADTVKQVGADGLVRGTPDRSMLRVMQTPHAFRGDALGALLDLGFLGSGLLDLACDLAAAGHAVHMVPGDPLAFAVRSPWDLELAELMLAGAGP